jgi:WD40 repeat protein
VQSLGIQKRLREHRGCVNTVSFNSSGSLLLSGSDDMTLVLWDWEAGTPATSLHTGHENNVLHAQFMPSSNDRSIVTAGADVEVQHTPESTVLEYVLSCAFFVCSYGHGLAICRGGETGEAYADARRRSCGCGQVRRAGVSGPQAGR